MLAGPLAHPPAHNPQSAKPYYYSQVWSKQRFWHLMQGLCRHMIDWQGRQQKTDQHTEENSYPISNLRATVTMGILIIVNTLLSLLCAEKLLYTLRRSEWRVYKGCAGWNFSASSCTQPSASKTLLLQSSME